MHTKSKDLPTSSTYAYDFKTGTRQTHLTVPIDSETSNHLKGVTFDRGDNNAYPELGNSSIREPHSS